MKGDPDLKCPQCNGSGIRPPTLDEIKTKILIRERMTRRLINKFWTNIERSFKNAPKEIIQGGGNVAWLLLGFVESYADRVTECEELKPLGYSSRIHVYAEDDHFVVDVHLGMGGLVGCGLMVTERRTYKVFYTRPPKKDKPDHFLGFNVQYDER